MKKIIITAMTREKRIIGKDNWLPWEIKEELQMFRRLTEGSTVIMGRKTYESIGRPMPKRQNVVVSRTATEIPLVETAKTIEEALHKATTETVFIIGGAQIYKLALEKDLVDEMYISFIKKEYEGDTIFPAWNEDVWEQVKEEDHNEFTFTIWRKK